MTLRLRLYETFRVVASEGGVTAAARVLHKVPSAVHHDLAALEAQLGCKLFERSGRRLVLTAQGRALQEVVAGAMGELARAELALRTGGRPLPLRIATVSGFGRYRLAPALLATLPPDRPLQLEFGTHEAVVAAVRSGRVDCGVTYRATASAPLLETPIASERLVLVGAAGTAAPPTLDAAAFVSYDESDYAFARWLAASDMSASPAYLDHFAELEEALESVACGRGVTVAPEDACHARAYAGRLEVLWPERSCSNEVFALSLGDRSPLIDTIAHALQAASARAHA